MFRGEMDEEGVRQERGEGMVLLVDGSAVRRIFVQCI